MINSFETENIRAVSDVVVACLETGAKTATKYISDKLVIRVSAKLIGGKLPPKRVKSLGFVLTIGAPNFEAREFIKVCKKAKEPFPVKKIQLKFPSKK